MEEICWDSSNQTLIPGLDGLPYIRVNRPDGTQLTNSLLEAHRINSEYIMDNKLGLKEKLINEIHIEKNQPIDWQRFYTTLLKYDINSLIHGTFLEEIDGRLRITRVLSAFIEAKDVRIAESGGVKINIVEPGLKGGKGNVPYHRTEFTAGTITAYINLDMSLLNSYGLPREAVKLLITLSLLKIRRFFNVGLRLRTACDLEMSEGVKIKRPEGFTLPNENVLLDECRVLIQECSNNGLFATPSVTVIKMGD